MGWNRGRRRAREDQRLRALDQFRLGIRLAREDLRALADRLEDSPPWMDGDAVVEWKQAAGLCGAAQAALRDAADLAQVLAVHTTLREARFHLARAEAMAFDEDPPTSSEPCFFDPRHGPATCHVDWLDAGVVPMCRDDADLVGSGFAPRRRRPATYSFTDQAEALETSPVQRLLREHARGAGGYAQGALNGGSPHLLQI